jgi:hypothetical protein
MTRESRNMYRDWVAQNRPGERLPWVTAEETMARATTLLTASRRLLRRADEVFESACAAGASVELRETYNQRREPLVDRNPSAVEMREMNRALMVENERLRMRMADLESVIALSRKGAGQ